MNVYFCFISKLREETTKASREIVSVQSLPMINEKSVKVSGTTEDSISEPRQVGQESGISP